MPTPPRVRAVLIALLAVALAACGGGGAATESAGSSEGGDGGEPVTLSWMVSNTDPAIPLAEALVEAYTAENPNVTIEVEARPGGSEGDNIVRTRLATNDMTDMFQYNSGSLFQALNPAQTLVPLTGEEMMSGLGESFTDVVTAGDGDVFGVPLGTARGGGVLYNIPIYEELGLEIPETWDAFVENSEAVAEAGYAPVIQTYGDTWTSQLLVLADYHNVEAQVPGFAEEFTANQAKFADTPAAMAGFEHLQQVHDEGLQNEDFASATYEDGLRMIAQGDGAHYPMLSNAIVQIATNTPDLVDDVGMFALPGQDAADYGLTVWPADAIYLPQSTPEEKRQAVLDFMAFAASPAGCEAMNDAAEPSGPYHTTDCELPDDVPQAVADMLPFFEDEATTPALEFLSPVKGPALEQITVEVGSGIRGAQDGARLYDQDVEKQAQQLGLEGW